MKKRTIPGIHNYCERRCGRCCFVSRCAVGIQEQKHPIAPKNEEEYRKEIHKTLTETFLFIENILRNAGIDPEEASKTELPAPDPHIKALQASMKQKGLAYIDGVNRFFKENEVFFEHKGMEAEQNMNLDLSANLNELMLVAEAVSTIRWFQHFIFVKADRAISGRAEWESEAEAQQSDANGSAKICLIAIQKSCAAWEVMQRNFLEKTGEITPLLAQLRSVRLEMESLFQDWQKFVRPGFDTEKEPFALFHEN